ncbi:MAG: hypothetical protein DSY42_04780, partial [Aquifex sp.]
VGVELINKQIEKLEEKKIELEIKGDTKELEKVEAKISELEKKAENLSVLPRDFTEALKEAQKAQRLLRIEALKSVATYQELLTIFQAISSTGYSAGLSTEQLVKLTVLVSNAVKAMGLDLNQAAQEARDLIQGTIDMNSQLAKALGITSEMVKEWRKAGTLYENITQSLQGFANASNYLQNTLSGIISNLKDAFDVIAEITAKPLFSALKKDLKGILDSILMVKTEGKNAANSLREMLNPSLVSRAQTLGEAIKVIYESLKAMAEGAGKAINDVANTIGKILTPLKGIYSEFKPFIDMILKAVGYIGTIALLLLPFGKLIGIVRMLAVAFSELRIVIVAVMNALKNPSAVLRSFTSLKNAIIEIINWFRNLGTVGKAVLISLFLQAGNIFNWIKEKIKNAFNSAVISVKQLWAGFLAWLAETSAQILSKIPGFKDLAQGLREEAAKLRQYIEQLKQEKIKLEVEINEEKIKEKLYEVEGGIYYLKEKLKQFKLDIPIQAQVSPLKEKLSQLSEIPISKEVKLSPETSEVERVIEKLSSMEIVVPVKFVAEGDYSPSWE